MALTGLLVSLILVTLNPDDETKLEISSSVGLKLPHITRKFSLFTPISGEIRPAGENIKSTTIKLSLCVLAC